jgi:hypothetical protein
MTPTERRSEKLCRFCEHPLCAALRGGYCSACLHAPCYVEFCVCGRGLRSLDLFPPKKSVTDEASPTSWYSWEHDKIVAL